MREGRSLHRSIPFSFAFAIGTTLPCAIQRRFQSQSPGICDWSLKIRAQWLWTTNFTPPEFSPRRQIRPGRDRASPPRACRKTRASTRQAPRIMAVPCGALGSVFKPPFSRCEGRTKASFLTTNASPNGSATRCAPPDRLRVGFRGSADRRLQRLEGGLDFPAAISRAPEPKPGPIRRRAYMAQPVGVASVVKSSGVSGFEDTP